MKRAILVAGIAVASTVLTVSAGVSAQADESANAIQNFTITYSEGESVVPDKVVNLRCRPTGGTHPSAAAACAIVAQVGGLGLEDMDLNPGAICTQEYNPRTVSVVGNDHFAWIDFQKTYGNPCLLNAFTGAFYQI